jgi:hypothetical protein
LPVMLAIAPGLHTTRAFRPSMGTPPSTVIRTRFGGGSGTFRREFHVENALLIRSRSPRELSRGGIEDCASGKAGCPAAEGELRAACDLDARAVAPRLFLGRLYAMAGNLADARALYQNLKTVAPDDPQAYQSLGAFYVSSGRLEAAAGEFRSLLTTGPRTAPPRHG